MIKKSFIGFLKPRIQYETIGPTTPAPQEIATPGSVTLLVEMPLTGIDALLINIGDTVKTGQKLTVFKDCDEYTISTVTGTITNIEACAGDQGRKYTEVTIKAEGEETLDESFSKKPSLTDTANFLACIPGKPDLSILADPEKKIKTIVVTGMDPDLMVSANQFAVRYHTKEIKKGIEVLKEITGVGNVVLTIPPSLERETQVEKIDVKVIDTKYPSALPHMIAKDVLGEEVPVGKKFEDVGILFINAEAVAALATAYEEGVIPVKKIVTVIDKDGSRKMVSAVVGTPINSIFRALGIEVNEKDRVIIGGPLTGSSIYSLNQPILPDTDAVMIQDKEDVSLVSDNACINCGECINVCPSKVPVNLLVRFLEAGEYGEAADNYDLYSCIECGLCSYVCTTKIPIFQYIRLAKYEHALILAAEAAEAEAEAEAAEAENV